MFVTMITIKLIIMMKKFMVDYQVNSVFLTFKHLLHNVEKIPSVQSFVATSSRPNIWGAVIDWNQANSPQPNSYDATGYHLLFPLTPSLNLQPLLTFYNYFQPRFKSRSTFYKLALTWSLYLQTLGFILISRVGTPFSVNARIKHCMQVVFPAPVGPMVINPCLTNEVSYSCTILRFQLGKFTNPISRDWLAIARCRSFQAWLWSLIPGNMSSIKDRNSGSSSSTNLLRFISLENT